MVVWSRMKGGSNVNCIENRQAIDFEGNGSCFDDGDGCGEMGIQDFDGRGEGERDSMVGCSNLKDGSGGICIESHGISGSHECYVDNDDHGDFVEMDYEDVDETARGLFDQVLMVFLRGMYAKIGIRPVPSLLGDGQELDLFKLFCLVREMGGFRSVSKGKLWGVIAEKCGFDFKVSAALKLVYFKYLNELDQWLNRVTREGISKNGGYECGGNMVLLSLELVKRFRDVSKIGREMVKKDETAIPVGFDEIGEGRLQFHGRVKENKISDNLAITTTTDDDENICYGNGQDIRLVQNHVQNEISSRKRKRDMLSGMLIWMTQVAKDPYNPSIGRIPESSRWKENGTNALWSWVLWAREATMQRRYGDSKEQESPSQLKKLKMHPSMYEDPVASSNLPTEGLRGSKRVPSLVKTTLCSCCNTCSLTKTKLASPPKRVLSPLKAILKDPVEDQEPDPVTVAPSREPIDAPSCDDLPIEKHVPIGLRYQAQVPQWAMAIYDCDSKWLGTKTWPSDDKKRNPFILAEPPGKGRPESCDCHLPGSVECIRFHISENRMKLKLELGLTFHRWKFDKMGEETSLSWSEVEEKRFKQVMRLKLPSLGKSYFPKKTRKELVSYYYNVFLIRRRCYQNRVTPRNIDSDDEESEFGSSGGPFGQEAVKVGRSKLFSCTQNKQCFDLD